MKTLTTIISSILMLLVLVSCEETNSASRRTTGGPASTTAASQYASEPSPDSQEIAAVPSAEAQQIDSEVSRIMAGEHGELPEAHHHGHADHESHVAQIHILNRTAYTLTVLFSGPTSRRATVPSGSAQWLSLATGAYNVAAEVNAADVEPFAGTDTFEGGVSDYTFIIETQMR